MDREAEAELRAAAEARGGRVVRANIGDSDPAQHFIDHVLPQLEKLRSTQRAARMDPFPRARSAVRDLGPDRRPCSGGAHDIERAAQHLHSVRQASQAGSSARVGAADAVV